MKEFFLNILSNLDKLAGLRQIEKIYAQHSDQNEAKKEINDLLNILVGVAAQFAYIPESEQKRIIQHSVMTDPEFTSLNARIVYKWLSVHKDKYYREIAHMENPVPENYEIVTGEKREAYLNQWLAALAPMDERINTTSKNEVKLLGRERTYEEHVIHENGLTPEIVSLQSNIRRIAGERYKDQPLTGFKHFRIRDHITIYAKSEADAKIILEMAELES